MTSAMDRKVITRKAKPKPEEFPGVAAEMAPTSAAPVS